MVCVPAMIILLLLFLAILFEIYIFGFYILDFIGNILFTLFFVFIINWICNTTFSWISWLIVIFSIFILVFIIFLLKNKTRSEIKNDFEKDKQKYPNKSKETDHSGFCSMYDKNECATYKSCNWAGNKCVTATNYQNNLNKLKNDCSILGKNNCNSDKRCYLFDNTCQPSLIGSMDLLNKDDCINIITSDYKKMLNTLSLKEQEERVKKDNPFFLKSFKNIDTIGCGSVMQNMNETLYGNKK